MSETDKKWLVKSDNVVLGPYTKSEVKQLVSDALVSINDEITEPCTFWWVIQDHPEFKSFTKSINFQTRITNLITGMGSRLTTTGKTDKRHTSTQTITDTAVAEEAVFKSVEVKVNEPVLDKIQKESIPDFQSKIESQREAAKKTQQIIKRLWHLVILISLGVLVYIVYREVFVPSQKKVETLVNVRQSGMKAYREGNKSEALKHLNEGLKENLLSDEEKVALASLLLQKKETEKVSEIISRLSPSQFKNVKVLNLQGLLYLLEKNFQVAESFFLSALEAEKKTDTIPTRSLINLALLNYIKGDFASTEKLINQLMSLGYERGLLYYLKILNSLSLVLTTQSEEKNKVTEDIPKDQIQKDINFFMKIDPEYRQEFYALLAWLNRNDKKERENYIRKTLNEDPYFIEEYDYDLFTGNRLLDWSHLMPYCKDLFEKDMENPLFNSFYALCYIKSGQKRQAEVYLETAKKQASDNPLITSIYSYSLMEKGQMERAKSLLEVIQDNKSGFPYTVPYALKARIYILKKEWPLAILTLKALLSIDSGHISGLGGMAYASFQIGNNKDYMAYKERALRRYPHYKKLLTLKNKSSF